MAVLRRAQSPPRDSPTSSRGLSATICPACAYRDEGVVRDARTLLDELADNRRFRADFRASCGLCIAHFRLAWDVTRSAQERALLRETNLDAARALLDEIREHIRKQRAEFRHDPAGAEADSWQRALWLTGGWPPPQEPAGVPEHGR